MLQPVFGRDLRLSDGVMAEVNGVRHLDFVCCPWGVFLAAAVFKGHTQAQKISPMLFLYVYGVFGVRYA